jgi:hypothetical protein
MTFIHVLLAGLALTSTVSALPSHTLSKLAVLHDRAVGDACNGTHGEGTCQSTTACKGISYEEPFCPDDPEDIQVSRLPKVLI